MNNKFSCPLCGDQLVPVKVSSHTVPRDVMNVDFENQRATLQSVGNVTYVHQFEMNGVPVSLCACDRCGYVKAVKVDTDNS